MNKKLLYTVLLFSVSSSYAMRKRFNTEETQQYSGAIRVETMQAFANRDAELSKLFKAIRDEKSDKEIKTIAKKAIGDLHEGVQIGVLKAFDIAIKNSSKK